MADGGYTSVDGYGVVRVTQEIGGNIKLAIKQDTFVDALTFPRLRLASFPGMGYETGDFKAIANMIKPGMVEIYKTTQDQIFNARWCSIGDNNFYMLTPKVANNPIAHLKTILHETAHAIQDWKQWRESALDREVDAHFAAALWLVRKGKQYDADVETYMTYFIIGAEAYIDDPKVIKSKWFDKMYKEMQKDIRQHYQFMHCKLNPNADVAEFLKAFEKKKNLDGIPG